jgi:hypothetical protein
MMPETRSAPLSVQCAASESLSARRDEIDETGLRSLRHGAYDAVE